jgi:predicted AAA+ superfamily ATPase
MTLFERSLFKDIIKYLDKPDIVVLHGVRQVGKTSLLKYIQAHCEERGLPTLYFDLEDTRHATTRFK